MSTLLISFFMLIIIICYMQLKQIRMIPKIFMLLSILGIYFVIHPEVMTVIANYMGVGRGADLLLYLGAIFGFVLALSLFIQIRILNRELAQVVRWIAITNAQKKG